MPRSVKTRDAHARAAVGQRRHVGHGPGLAQEVELGAQAAGELAEHVGGPDALPDRGAPLGHPGQQGECRQVAPMTSAMPGRWTLTTTGSPDCRQARWVWPIEAAASGARSKLAKTDDTGAPSSASSTASMFSTGSVGALFCSFDSSPATSGGTRSTRVAAIWPSFT